MKKNFKGFIFDLDGTLLDSMFIWETLGEDYIKANGLIPEENTQRILKKMNIREASVYFSKTYPLQKTPDEIEKEMLGMVDDFYFYKAQLKSGVKSFIEAAHESGVKMVVATVSDRYLTKKALERCGIDKYIKEIFVAGELETNKTQPLIYMKALQSLSEDIKDICVFEDTLHAAKTAKDAGFYVIGIKDEAESKNEQSLKDICDEYSDSFEKLIHNI